MTCSLCNKYIYPWQKTVTVAREYGKCHSTCGGIFFVGYMNCATDLLRKYSEQLEEGIKKQAMIAERARGVVH